MFKIREWERYKFMIEYEHEQASNLHVSMVYYMKPLCSHPVVTGSLLQHQRILERQLPETLKLSIAKKIENNLFLKVNSSRRKSAISS